MKTEGVKAGEHVVAGIVSADGARDRAEFERLVSEFYQPVLNLCYHYLGSRADAEDAAQEVFIKALSAMNRFRPVEKVKQWIFAIARNHCVDRLRWWKRYANFLSTREDEGQYEPSDLAKEIMAIVSTLPMKQRDVFILRHFHGFSTLETAEMLGIQESTVKTNLRLAILKLRKKIPEGSL